MAPTCHPSRSVRAWGLWKPTSWGQRLWPHEASGPGPLPAELLWDAQGDRSKEIHTHTPQNSAPKALCPLICAGQGRDSEK